MRPALPFFPCLLAALILLPLAGLANPLTDLSAIYPERKKISVVVTRGVTHTRQLPRQLQSTRKAMLAGRPMVDEQLRDLAKAHDSLAALRYTKRLMARDGSPAEIAYYASLAAAGGRASVFDDMVKALYSLRPGDMEKTRLSHVISVLYGYAFAGNTLALDAVMDLNGPKALFGEMSPKTRERLLSEGLEIGDGRIELRLAMQAISERTVPTQVIVGYLLRAERMGDLAVRTTAENLRRHIDPVQSVSN